METELVGEQFLSLVRLLAWGEYRADSSGTLRSREVSESIFSRFSACAEDVEEDSPRAVARDLAGVALGYAQRQMKPAPRFGPKILPFAITAKKQRSRPLKAV